MTRGGDDHGHSRSTLRLCRTASTATATELRRVVRAWVDVLGVAAELGIAIELACYEALANVVCHAYPGRVAGLMELDATYDHTPPGAARITVTVTDHGRWRPPATDLGRLRGRGVPMIQSMAGAAEIVTDATGTTVQMSWELPRAPASTRS